VGTERFLLVPQDPHDALDSHVTLLSLQVVIQGV